jgi:acyl-CoA thioesterase FadM
MAHYNSFIRIPLLVARNAVAPLSRIGTLETDVLKLRVWPNDVDFNLHLNNARYLSVMDYGRIHLLARVGLLTPSLKARWAPVVGAVWMTYRRSLQLLARYQLATRLVCWDDRWFYMEQTFTGGEGLAAVGWVKGALVDKAGIVLPQKIMDLVEPGILSPPLPEAIQILNGLTREKLHSATEPTNAPSSS